MENSKHTQGEWTVSDEGNNGIFIHVNRICSPALAKLYTKNDIVESRGQALANAERIVKAINNHDELVGTLMKIKNGFNGIDPQELTRVEKTIISMCEEQIKKVTE